MDTNDVDSRCGVLNAILGTNVTNNIRQWLTSCGFRDGVHPIKSVSNLLVLFRAWIQLHFDETLKQEHKPQMYK